MGVAEMDAEELVQDTLLKVHTNVGTFHRDGRAKLTTWVFRIAQNCAIDFHRVHREKLQELPEGLEPVRWHVRFAGHNSEHLTWLGQELPKFSAEDQQILLWHAHKFSFGKIGDWLGLKEATARVRHFRAMKKLKTAAGLVCLELGDTHE